MTIRCKRAYAPAAAADGFRVLVDGLWPRGISKKDADLDLWAKDIAPSAGLRKWFGHDPARWRGFVSRYRAELRSNRTAVAAFKAALRGKRTVTFVYAARDEEHNNAVALTRILRF